MTDGLNEAGDVTLSDLRLINSNNQALDITHLLLELNIYEDIFSHTMSGSVTIFETMNLLNLFPLIGEETLAVEFSTPGLDTKIKKTFSVYKLSDRIIGGDKRAMYVLHFISPEAINDLNNRVSRAFSGYTHVIAQEVFNTYLADSDNRLQAEESTNQIKLVSPYWSPSKCINYCAARSIDSTNFRAPNFLFFESNQAHKFVSLNSLFANEPNGRYFYDSDTRRDKKPGSAQSTRDIAREMFTVQELTVGQTFDYIDRIMNGVYSNRVYEADVLKKTVKPLRYNYWYDFNQTEHLSPHPMASNLIRYDDTGLGRIQAKTIVPMSHNMSRTDKSAEILVKRVPLLSQLRMYHIDITIPGRTDLEVGDVIDFNLGQYGLDAGKDKFYSGKYLVGAIMHRVTQTKHRMVCQLVKESVETEITFE